MKRIPARGWIVAASALALAGCGESQLGETEVTTNEVTDEAAEEPQRLTPVDTPPEIEVPALGPISYAEIEVELEPGAGCSAFDDGKALLVAVEGDAIARPYGTMRHFEFDGDFDALWDGGTFTAGAITIIVTPEDGEGERVETQLVKSASILIREEGQEDEVEMRAEWLCGA
ncbi:MAG: hypothetical protein AAGE05_11835 [Pseudomonadota bacterium]